MRHERGIKALDLHPIIKCLVETRLAWQLSVSDVASRMGSSYFTLKRYERGAEFPSGKMLLKWVDVLSFELVLRHKKSAVSDISGSVAAERGYGSAMRPASHMRAECDRVTEPTFQPVNRAGIRHEDAHC
jgi:hypothetical protein